MKECTFRLENFFKKQSSIKVQSMGWKFLYYRQEHWQKIQVKSNFFCTPRKIDEVCQTMKINPTQKPFELVRTNFFLKMLIQKECAQSFLMSVIRLLIYNSGTSNFWWIPAAPPPSPQSPRISMRKSMRRNSSNLTWFLQLTDIINQIARKSQWVLSFFFIFRT